MRESWNNAGFHLSVSLSKEDWEILLELDTRIGIKRGGREALLGRPRAGTAQGEEAQSEEAQGQEAPGKEPLDPEAARAQAKQRQ